MQYWGMTLKWILNGQGVMNLHSQPKCCLNTISQPIFALPKCQCRFLFVFVIPSSSDPNPISTRKNKSHFPCCPLAPSPSSKGYSTGWLDYATVNTKYRIKSLVSYLQTRRFQHWSILQYLYQAIVNPLTPVPPVTARDEPWPFFHF